MKARFIAAWLAAALAAPALAQPDAATDPYAQGVALRHAGRAAEAIPYLEAASRARPHDADVWLNLGLAYSAANRLEDAERALGEAQRLAPEYAEVRLALARTAFFRGDLGEAERRLHPLLSSDEADARALADQIAEARQQGGARWRFDLTWTRGERGAGLSDTGVIQAAAGRTANGVTLVGSAEYVRQFGRSDVYIEGVAAGRRGYLALGGTPDADFRAEWTAKGGLTAAPHGFGDGWTATLGLDGAFARYPTGPVWGLHPSVTVARGETLSLTARWINVIDETDKYRAGYALRAGWRPLPRLGLAAGWSEAPESSEGPTVRVQAVSLGAAVDLSDALTLRVDGVHEMRPAYDHDLVSFGMTRRF